MKKETKETVIFLVQIVLLGVVALTVAKVFNL